MAEARETELGAVTRGYARQQMADAIARSARRQELMRQVKPCAACGSDQVQLVDFDPAEWRCRMCGAE